MKATNKFSDFTVKRIPVPEVYHEEPNNFKKYIWESADGRFIPIKEFNDHHLIHTYQMLANTILYAREKAKHTMLTSTMRRTITTCNYHLHYIGYELFLRHYPECEPEETNKYSVDSKAIEL